MKTLLLVISLLFSTNLYAELNLNSKSVLVIDINDGEILVDKNSTTQRSIASITKLMTAIVILDSNIDLNEIITISQEDVMHTTLHHKKTSQSLPAGLQLSRAELLHLTLMNSQNRAAFALARTYPGGLNAFVEAMNNKAQVLGMMNTKYVDPTGLFNGNISTAEDLTVLLKHAVDYPLIKDFSTATSFSTTLYVKHKKRLFAFNTTNRLVTQKSWNIILQKTGYIVDAGRCLVMLTSIDTRNIAIVLLNSNSTEDRATDAIKIKFWLEHGREGTHQEIIKLSPYNKKHHRKYRQKKAQT